MWGAGTGPSRENPSIHLSKKKSNSNCETYVCEIVSKQNKSQEEIVNLVCGSEAESYESELART